MDWRLVHFYFFLKYDAFWNEKSVEKFIDFYSNKLEVREEQAIVKHNVWA